MPRVGCRIKYGIRDLQGIITFVWRQQGLPAEFKVFVDCECKILIERIRAGYNKGRKGRKGRNNEKRTKRRG